MKNINNIQDLIRGCIAQDRQAQRALVDHYSGMLCTLCRRYLKDHELAKDLLQDSLVKIFQNLNHYDSSKGSFESWISTIAIRLCLTRFKKNKSKLISLDVVSLDNSSLHIESDALNNIDIEILLQFIDELPEGYHVVFNMAAIDGYSHKEIAKLLNISEIASRSRLNRAKNMLRVRVEALKKTESWVNSI